MKGIIDGIVNSFIALAIVIGIGYNLVNCMKNSNPNEIKIKQEITNEKR